MDTVVDTIPEEPTWRQIAKWRRDVIEERERLFSDRLNHRFVRRNTAVSYTAQLKELAVLKALEGAFTNG